jgi:trigger factor
MRAAIVKELTQGAEEQAKEDLIEEITDTLLEDAQIVFPPAAVELQIDDMVTDFRNRLTRSGWQFQDYLQLQGMTEEALRDDFRENAETQLRRQLVLRQFILDEKLRVSAEDIDRQIEERVARFDKDTLKESMREYYRSGQGFEAVSSLVLRDKVYERLEAILSGTAPDLAELDVVDETAEDEEE